jgi:hypothetical protein
MKLTTKQKQLVKEYIQRLKSKRALNEAALPGNIQKWASTRGILPTVKKIATWAEKSGESIVGGTAIGKNYETLILDLTLQGGEIRFNIKTGKITLYDEPVTDEKSFAKILQMNKQFYQLEVIEKVLPAQQSLKNIRVS